MQQIKERKFLCKLIGMLCYEKTVGQWEWSQLSITNSDPYDWQAKPVDILTDEDSDLVNKLCARK